MIEKAASRSLRRAPPDGDRSTGCRLINEAYQPVGMLSRRVSYLMSVTVRRLYIDRAPLRLACKDTPLQIGDEAAKHQENGHDQVGTAHRWWIEVWTDFLRPIDQLRRTSCKLT